MKPMRIFWLGMHNVLTQTELPGLRQLGFEVYNPPYLSDIVDQSAVKEWVAAPTTLPGNIQLKLNSTNFFYQQISDDVAEILNEYFDAVIVTISPTWLKYFMDAYKGPVIYRVYGQPYSLAQELARNGSISKISDRDNFWFCPHSEYTLYIEDEWLQERMKIVPYCLTQDVTLLKNRWELNADDSTIGLLCPRAGDNTYYNDNYKYLAKHFPGDHFKVFGAQIVKLTDPRIVGTLERDEFLRRILKLRGYVYHYTEPTVCYLPPIEFMTMGGPVIFQSGSLLARYFSGHSAPGMAKDAAELKLLAERLRSGDQGFIREVIESQDEVRNFYDPEYVWPKFDVAFLEMLNIETAAPAPRFMLSVINTSTSVSTAHSARVTILLFHQLGRLIHKNGSNYHCSEKIAQVALRKVKVLLEAGETIVVTAFANDIDRVRGFFAPTTTSQVSLKILCVDNDNWAMNGRELMGSLKCDPIIFDDIVLSGGTAALFYALIDEKIQKIEAQAQKKEAQAQKKEKQLEDQLAVICASTSWRITRPLRAANLLLQQFKSKFQ